MAKCWLGASKFVGSRLLWDRTEETGVRVGGPVGPRLKGDDYAASYQLPFSAGGMVAPERLRLPSAQLGLQAGSGHVPRTEPG